MGVQFKLLADDYSQRVQAFRDSFDGADIAADVARTSKCPGLIVNEFVDRANQLVELISKYKRLIRKDGSELESIVNDLMRQEEQWALSISEGTAGRK